MKLCVMTLRNFPPFFGPNVISSSVDTLLSVLTEHWEWRRVVRQMRKSTSRQLLHVSVANSTYKIQSSDWP